MNWSPSPPTEQGWYWMRRRYNVDGAREWESIVVWVYLDLYGLLRVLEDPCRDIHAKPELEWAGPIANPAERAS